MMILFYDFHFLQQNEYYNKQKYSKTCLKYIVTGCNIITIYKHQ